MGKHIMENNIIEKLKDAQCKVTRQRIEVGRLLQLHAGQHLSVEDLHAIMLKENANIGLTTIYRTLDLFETVGIVQKIDFGDGRIRYEIKNENPDKHHHHLICIGCGKVTEFEDKLMDEREVHIAKLNKFKTTEHHIKFLGYCWECQCAKK